MPDPDAVVRVLHVDDEPDFADMTAQFLEREDDRFDVVTEQSAAAGLERFASGEIDCIVSDYDMPNQDGLAFLRDLRVAHPAVPFILFTGKGSEEIASEAISVGVTDYIQKDVGSDQYTILANRILNAVDRHRAVRRTDVSHRAMDTANEGLSLVRPDGTFSYVNPAFARLFGYNPAELLDEQWTVLYHNEEAERLRERILPAVRETGYWSGETVRLTKDGERMVTDHRLANTDEGVIVCTAQDVTDERLDASAQTDGFGLLVDAMEDYAFYTLDHEGYVTRWNEGAARLKGYGAEEAIGRHMSTFFTETERETGVPAELLDTAVEEGSANHQGWRVRKDGSRFWATVRISASYDDSGTVRGFGKMIKETSRETVVQPAQ